MGIKTDLFQDLQGTFVNRFWNQVEKKGLDECWPWKGHIGTKRYGQIRVGGRNGKMVKANRASWMIHYGPIPEGMLVCHHCDNPACVNPNHIFLGTQKDNMKDMIRKGRANKAIGSKTGNAKLTEDEVRQIVDLFLSGRCTRKEIAPIFGVSYSLIKQIIRGEVWKHVTS